jgi:cytochrome c oxidase subunit 2
MSAPLSIFSTSGAGAAHIAALGLLLIAASALAYFLVVGMFMLSLRRARARSQEPQAPDPATERRHARRVSLAVGAVVLVLSFLVGASYRTDRALAGLEQPPALTVQVIAHQWWWELRYPSAPNAEGFVTANELHIPVNQPVALQVQSADVIHSLWLPNLAQKLDVIPGRSAELHVLAQRTGTYRGRCSEFCGFQHAHMDLAAVVEEPAAFQNWLAAQAAERAPPQGDAAQRGEQVFSESACVSCHVVRGSPAYGYSSVAPDLTHLKSRGRIAGGALSNDAANLRLWVTDPHAVKPGVRMPPVPMPDADRDALLAYLEGLR